MFLYGDDIKNMQKVKQRVEEQYIDSSSWTHAQEVEFFINNKQR